MEIELYNQKAKGSEKKGFKDSRSQGVEWFSWYLFFKTKRVKESEKRRVQGFKESRSQVEKAEEARRIATHLTF